MEYRELALLEFGILGWNFSSAHPRKASTYLLTPLRNYKKTTVLSGLREAFKSQTSENRRVGILGKFGVLKVHIVEVAE